MMAEIFKEKLFGFNFEMNNNTTFAVIAITGALALLGFVGATILTIPLQQAEAGCITGYFNSGNQSAVFTAFEKSEGRCA
jgi:hypothetical protein